MLTISSLFLSILFNWSVKAQSHYGQYYLNQRDYPYQMPNSYDAYARPFIPVSRVGVMRSLNRHPYDTQIWPVAMLNGEGQSTGNINTNSPNQISNDLINSLTFAFLNALTSALFPQQNYGGSSPPFVGLIPSAGINLGPSNQYSYGSNFGVYAGIQNSQTGYSYNYNSNNAQQAIQPYNRPYGPSNSNVAGTYGGLSQWPFIQPVPNNERSTTSTTSTIKLNYVSSTIARPQSTLKPESSEVETTGVVTSLSLQDLIEDARNG